MCVQAVLQDSIKMLDLSKSSGQVDKSIETLEADWMALLEQYEEEKLGC